MVLDDLCNATSCDLISNHHHNETFRQAMGFGLAVSSVMSTVENAIVIIVLLKYRVLYTSSNVILMSLALANFFSGSLVAPLYSLEWLNIINVTSHSDVVIVTRESLIRIFFGITTLSMAFISYDRYLHIRNLQKYKMSKKFLYTGLVLCWFAPIAISSLYLPVVHFKKTIYAEIVSMAFSVMTLIAIIVPYAGILLVLRRHTKLSGNHVARLAFSENQNKAARTAAIIVTVYLLMNGPAIINEVLLYSYELGMTCAFLVMANSCVNPIIYFYQTPTLKKHALMCLGITKPPGSIGSTRSRSSSKAETMIIVDNTPTLNFPNQFQYEKRLCSIWSHLLNKTETICLSNPY